MRIVFDLDDTICRTQNRDYANSTEISDVVFKMKQLRETLPGTEIIVHTSRGMASCNGDVEAAEKKNRPIIEKWLKDHGIEVDGIIFGKPLADIYVDDKAMTAQDFGNARIETYSGFSGANVTRIGKVVIKEAENTALQAEWYRQAKKHYEARTDIPWEIKIPEVYSVTLGKLYMEYMPGLSCSEWILPFMLENIAGTVIMEPTLNGHNDLYAYAKYVESRAASIGLKTDIGTRIRDCAALEERTFCHGDLSLQNIIYANGSYAFIDPSPKQGMESWIMDIAKLRASLNILDKALAGISHQKRLVRLLDGIVQSENKDLEAVKLVEESHIIRVWYYARKLGKKKQETMLSNYYKEHYGQR